MSHTHKEFYLMTIQGQLMTIQGHYSIVELFSSFSTDCSKALLLLHPVFVCASVVSHVAYVLFLFVFHLCCFWCLGRAVLRDCDFSLVSPLVCFITSSILLHKKACRTLLTAVH